MSEPPVDNRGGQRPEDRPQSTNNGNVPMRPAGEAMPYGIQMPPGFNPAAGLPAHIQDQLRRNMQAQHMMRLQQQQQQQQMMMQGMASGGMSGMMGNHGYPQGPHLMHQQQQPTTINPNLLQGGMPRQQAPPPTSNAGHPAAQIPTNRLAMLSQVKPYNSTMDEQEFMQSLAHFLSCVNIPLKRLPNIAGKPVSLLALFRTVVSLGGFSKVSESRRWSSVAASVSLPPNSVDCLASVHSIYGTLLYPYEQFMIHKIPANAIQWPPGMAKVFAAAAQPRPAQPEQRRPSSAMQGSVSNGSLASMPSGRLVSTLSRVPSEESTSSIAQVAKKPMTTQLYSVESIGLQQWKTIKNQADPFQVLRRGLYHIKCAQRFNEFIGRYTFKDIVLLLESGLEYLVTFALNLLQIVAYDPNCLVPDVKTFRNIIKNLYRISSEINFNQKDCCSWDLSRSFANRHYDLSLVHEDGLDRIAQISNILRTIALRPDFKPLIEHLDVSMIELLFQWSCTVDSLEIRKNSMMFLAEMSPGKLLSASSEHILSFFRLFAVDLESLYPLVLGSSARLSLSCSHVSEETEMMKKLVIAMIQSTTSLFKTLPPLLYVELELFYRLSLQMSNEEVGRDKYPLMPILEQMMKLVEALIQPILRLIELVHLLLTKADFLGSPDHPKWCQKILHNTAFGLPDLGYLELLLLGLRTGLACVERGSDGIQVESLVRLVEGVRRLWLCPEFRQPIKFERQVHINAAASQSGPGRRSASQKTVSTVLTDKSPLLWQSCSASSSHPYQLYLLLVRLLVDVAEKDQGGVILAGTACRWLSGGDVECGLSRDVLNTAELCALYTRLLSL